MVQRNTEKSLKYSKYSINTDQNRVATRLEAESQKCLTIRDKCVDGTEMTRGDNGEMKGAISSIHRYLKSAWGLP